MTLEIIATNLTDAKHAEAYGADRLELSPGMLETGLTPSFGLIDAVANAVDIPFNVIVRPHSQSFIYNNDDIEVMQKDIEMTKQLGADGIVIGMLTPDHVIDEEVLKQLLHTAEGLDVTFHRAFDFVRDQEEALVCLAKYPQVKRVLTAAGQQPAPASIPNMKRLIKLAEDTHLEIMAGYGLKTDTFSEFYKEVNPKEVHFGSGVREDESYLSPIAAEKVKKIRTILDV